VNRYLVEGVAKAGLGEPFIVTDASQSLAVANRLREYVRTPVLTDVKVDFRGFDVYDVEPAFVPDVLADRPVIVHGKWRGKPVGSISVTGMTGTGAFSQAIPVGGAAPDPKNAPLKYLWARTRISNAWDFANQYSVDERTKKEIIGLGLKYELLTPFTSFIAVHEVVRNTTGTGEDVAQPLPMPEGVSDRSIGVGAEPELVLLLAAFGVWCAASLARRRRSAA
jgi:Ca-activated chloride channel family protein